MDCEYMCQNIIVLHQIRERKGKRTEGLPMGTKDMRLIKSQLEQFYDVPISICWKDLNS